MKNIKLFTNHSEYEQYINSAGKILPNVSYCLDARDVHYNDNTGGVIRAVYHAGTIKSTMVSVRLYAYAPLYGVSGSLMFSSAVINGVEVSSQDLDIGHNGEYEFETGTDNVVVFNALDTTLVGVIFEGSTIDRIGMTFASCPRLVSVELPNTVTTIGSNAFMGCTMLEGITLPSGVTDIYEGAFAQCANVITCLPTIPPILHGDPFPEENAIYVPAESLNAYKTAEGWSEYADGIFPIGGGNSGTVEL